MKNKKKGILLMILSLVVVVSSLAFFTDSKVDSTKMAFGSVSISTELSRDKIEDLAPGDKPRTNLNINNTGSLDAEVRTTFVLAVPEDEEFLYQPDWIRLYVDDVEVLNDVNITKVYDTKLTVVSGDSADLNIIIDISTETKNKIQSKGFRLDVLTEARQVGDIDWEELRTEKIGFGNDVDYDVVPETNLITSQTQYISRNGYSFVKDNGFVASFDNLNLPLNEYLENFDNNPSNLVVYDRDVKLSETDLVAPHMSIKLEKNGKVYDDLSVIRKGNPTGSGRPWAGDVNVVGDFNLEALKGIPFSGTDAEFYASDFDEDGLITSHDRTLVKAAVINEVDSFEAYPGSPRLNKTPKLEIKSFDADTGRELYKGEGVKAGQVIEFYLGVSDVANLKIQGFYFPIKYNGLGIDGVDDLNLEFNSSFADHLDPGTGRPGSFFSWSQDLYTMDDNTEILSNYNDNYSGLAAFTRPDKMLSYKMSVNKDLNIGDRVTFDVVDTGLPNFWYSHSSGLTFANYLSGDTSTYFVVE